MLKTGIHAYKKRNIQQELAEADPHKVTLLLMQGVLDKLAQAKGCLARKDLAGKSEHVSRVITIIMYLRDTLDLNVKEKVTDDLYSLYSFMVSHLTDSSQKDADKQMSEVIEMMLPIKMAWQQIPEAAKQQAYQAREQQAQKAQQAQTAEAV